MFYCENRALGKQKKPWTENNESKGNSTLFHHFIGLKMKENDFLSKWNI